MTTKKVVLTLGGKGGTGKTLFCRTLFHMHKGENVRVLGYDADRENPEFWDYHKEEFHGVKRLNFLEVDGARKLMDRLEEHQPEVALLDMPGASGAGTREQFERFDIFNTFKNELSGYEVTVVAVLNNCFNAIGSLEMMMESFGDQAHYVAVLSDFWITDKNAPFKRWKACETYQRFQQLQGKEVTLPMLEVEVFDVLHEQAWPFSKLNDLRLGDRILLRSYLARARAAFEPAHDYLGLPALDGRDTNELVNQGVTNIAERSKKSKATKEKAATK
jgi:hypothetical protein